MVRTRVVDDEARTIVSTRYGYDVLGRRTQDAGAGMGWPAKNGDVWVPETHGGSHTPHWDVQHKNGNHTPVYPDE